MVKKTSLTRLRYRALIRKIIQEPKYNDESLNNELENKELDNINDKQDSECDNNKVEYCQTMDSLDDNHHLSNSIAAELDNYEKEYDYSNGKIDDENDNESSWEDDLDNDDDDDETFNSTKDYNKKEEQLASYILKSEMTKFLASILGGERKSGFIKTLTIRFVRFCIWSYGIRFKAMITQESIFTWFIEVILVEYLLLQDYCINNLEKTCKPATIINHLSDLNSIAKWITTYTNLMVGRSESIQKFNNMVEQMCRQYRKKKLLQNYDKKSLNNLINEGKAPSGGLKQLKCLIDQYNEWALSILVTNNEDHKRFLGYIAASMYVLAPQGRIQAIQNLKLKDGHTLIIEDRVLCTEFKTSATYIYQPVILPASLKPILIKYVQTVRKSTSPYLWVTYSGLPVKSMGRLLTEWFKKYARLNINSTLLRTLVETEMNSLCQQNKISKLQQTAIQNINGHSSVTCKQYYVLNNMQNDINIGNQAFNQLYKSDMNSNICNSLLVNSSESTPTRLISSTTSSFEHDRNSMPDMNDYDELNMINVPTMTHLTNLATEPTIMPLSLTYLDNGDYNFDLTIPIVQIDWGKAHPNYNDDNRKRAVWTEDEKTIIASWINNRIKEMSPNRPGNLFKNCLEHIIKTTSLHKFFHKFHMQDSARLQQGYRQYNKDLQNKSYI